VTSKQAAGREGKGEDGRARTREVKMAVFFTQDKLDEDGCPGPGPLNVWPHLGPTARLSALFTWQFRR
jgi:hypothetical protein